jgi:hypothetical protein
MDVWAERFTVDVFVSWSKSNVLHFKQVETHT